MTISHITVAGLGKVGHLVALLLQDTGFHVQAIDQHITGKHPFDTIEGDVGSSAFMRQILKRTDAIVSCLPYHLNQSIANIAASLNVHYFDLTEDVPTQQFIQKLSCKSNAVLAPQCGLAPGFIGIVGANLAKKFTKIRSIELRVGALPQHPKGDLGYAFNWSPEGVVNEYLNDCIVLRDGQLKQVPSMQDLETIIIGGTKLEAFTTSGGLGTMCETFVGKAQELSYKTLRYPGHMRLMRFFFYELLMRNNREMAGSILVNAKPPVNDDVVYVHASVEGKVRSSVKKANLLRREEFVQSYYPKSIDGQYWRAISWTTACSVCAVVEMVANGLLPKKGYIKQESIDLEAFLSTKNGSMYNVS